MKYYLGIDPGKQGAFVVLNENSEIIEMIGTPLIGNEYNRIEIRDIIKSRDFARIGLENPGNMFNVGKAQATSLSNCVGLIEGILVGLEVPYLLIQPKEWQKECWTHVKVQKKSDGKNDTKGTSTLAATNLWSKVNFKITNKGGKSKNYNDGMIDAALIAEYLRRKF